MDFREACPEGYGFPATPAGCERAVQVSGFQKGEWSNEGPYEESHPTCFWADHDNNKAGFMYGTLCDENEMEQWGDLGAVCVRCDGACGGCFACDGEVSTVEDHEGGLWFVVAILGAVAAIASCAVVACLCYFSSRQRATPQGAMTEMAAAPGAQVVQIPPGVSAGQPLRISTAQGPVEFSVPHGAVPGQVIQVQLPGVSAASPAVIGQPVTPSVGHYVPPSWGGRGRHAGGKGR